MKLVHFCSEDGFRMDGILSLPPSPQAIIVHVHGKCGNFYQNDFISRMATRFPEANLAFLAFNNRGHDCLAEGYFDNRLEYIGGSVEFFEDSRLDIAAALEYASPIAPKVFLQGHSNGCEKILYFLANYSQNLRRLSGIILLSPCDSFALQQINIAPEPMDEQVERIEKSYLDNQDAILPDREYGIKVDGKSYGIPVTARSYLALAKGAAFRTVRYTSNRPSYLLPQRTLVCFNDPDPYLTVPIEVGFSRLKENLPNAEISVQYGADHHFHGAEDALISAIVSWSAQK